MTTKYIIQFVGKRYLKSAHWSDIYDLQYTNNKGAWLNKVSTDNIYVARQYKTKSSAKTVLTNCRISIRKFSYTTPIRTVCLEPLFKNARIVPIDTDKLNNKIPTLEFTKSKNDITIENGNAGLYCCSCGVRFIQMKYVKISGKATLCLFCCEKLIPAVQEELEAMPQELRDNYKAEQFLGKLG